jgi:predicted nucleotidyltransferase
MDNQNKRMSIMDQTDALAISRKYLLRLKETNLNFSNAWLFGSFAKGNQHEDSDIDIAIVMDNNSPIPFETEVKLMTCRKGDETLIEPHVFSKSDFDRSSPLVDQIMNYGVPICL